LKIKLKDIINGYKNYFIGEDEVTENEAKRRAAICSNCENAKHGMHAAILPDMKLKEIKGLYCGICKCPLSPKVRSINTECPAQKW